MPAWHLILRVDDLRLDLTGGVPTHGKPYALTAAWEHLLERRVRRRLLDLVVPGPLITLVELIRLPLSLRFRIHLQIIVVVLLLGIGGVFAHLGLVVLGILIEALVDALVVRQEKRLLLPSRHLIQLLSDLLRNILLGPTIIVVRVVLVNVVTAETLFLKLLAILRVEFVLSRGENFLLLLIGLVLVQLWNAVEFISREGTSDVYLLGVRINKVELVFSEFIVWTLILDFRVSFVNQQRIQSNLY